jgi:hypothetical protein
MQKIAGKTSFRGVRRRRKGLLRGFLFAKRKERGIMDEMLMMGREVLAEQPFSVLIGAELLKFSVGSAELKVPVKRELQQQHGFLHAAW